MRIRHSWSLKILVFILVATMAASCSARPTEEQQSRPYGDEGYMSLSRSNPNLPTNPTHYHYGKDLKLAREVLADIPEIQGSVIHLDGGTLLVTIRLPEGLSRAEIEQIEETAYDVLMYTFPRYKVDLTSDRSHVRRNSESRFR